MPPIWMDLGAHETKYAPDDGPDLTPPAPTKNKSDDEDEG